MTCLVDANVLSETTKPEPDPEVVASLAERESEIVVDPIVLGEIRYGILLMPRGRKRQRLERWFDEVVATIRCLPWDAATGIRWAELQAALRARGTEMPVQDSMIAATALLHDLTLATRNSRDFRNAGVRVVDPFE